MDDRLIGFPGYCGLPVMVLSIALRVICGSQFGAVERKFSLPFFLQSSDLNNYPPSIPTNAGKGGTDRRDHGKGWIC